MNDVAKVEAAPVATVVPFGKGDMGGKSLAAQYDAAEQLDRVKPGSARAKLYQLQARVAGAPEVDCPLQHTFAPGVYIRTIRIPKGVIIIGKIHKHAHGNVLSMGEVSVFTEQGGEERFKGPLTMLSQPGTKRAVIAHTDVVWTTIHPNPKNLTDLAEIEKEVIAATYEEYEQFVKQQKLLGGSP